MRPARQQAHQGRDQELRLILDGGVGVAPRSEARPDAGKSRVRRLLNPPTRRPSRATTSLQTRRHLPPERKDARVDGFVPP